jgi:hypothetical protein
VNRTDAIRQECACICQQGPISARKTSMIASLGNTALDECLHMHPIATVARRTRGPDMPRSKSKLQLLQAKHDAFQGSNTCATSWDGSIC